jgi:uncharacterized delta-60 repeat protein
VSTCRAIVGWKVLGMLCLAGALGMAGAAGAGAAGLDPSFGTNGRVVSDFGQAEARASALALAPDGSVLVAGTECSLPRIAGRSCDLALVRYGSDGSEWQRTPGGFAAHSDFAVNDLAVDSEGGIIVIGRRYSLGWSPDLVRYRPDGSVDPAFSAASLPQAFEAKEITAVAVDASNRILLAGDSATHEALVARLGPHGAADESFGGGDGVAAIQESGAPYVSALALGDEGRIFLAGSLDIGDPEAGATGAALIAALESDGEQAAGFSAPASFGHELVSVRDMKLDSLGRLLLSLEGNGARALPVVRLLPTGSLDEGFGNDGIATMPSCDECGVATALAVDGGDRPLLAGSPFRLGRYTAAGMVDDRLARGGSFTVDFGEGVRIEATDLAIDGAGRAIIAGSRIGAGGRSRFVLARLLVDGPVDACRGIAATVVSRPGDDALVGTTGRDVILDRGNADEVKGLGGVDLICAGKGPDVVRGGAGRDRIYGEAGADRVLGGPGADLISGANGADYIRGGTGRDRLFGGAGRDVIQGGAGADLLQGSGAGDRLLAQSGPDRLFGGAGNDVLSGGLGEDVVRGGAGMNRPHK